MAPDVFHQPRLVRLALVLIGILLNKCDSFHPMINYTGLATAKCSASYGRGRSCLSHSGCGSGPINVMSYILVQVIR